MFADGFVLTSAPDYEIPASFEGLLGDENVPAPGVYNNGLLTVIGKNVANNYLISWAPMFGLASPYALMVTGFGDVFFLEGSTSEIYFLDILGGYIEFVGRDLKWFINVFLLDSEINEKVLRREALESLVRRERPLLYGECFILKTWMPLIVSGAGGDDEYTVGKASVHVDIVGQTRTMLGIR
jgi:hypothetical protein